MTKLTAGTPVKRGYYLSLNHWSLNPVEKDGSLLEGQPGELFTPVPFAVAAALAPVFGAIFLMFMPFIGFYLVTQRVLTALAQPLKIELGAALSPAVPGTAHLTGRDGNTAGEVKELAEVEREIAARREDKNG